MLSTSSGRQCTVNLPAAGSKVCALVQEVHLQQHANGRHGARPQTVEAPAQAGRANSSTRGNGHASAAGAQLPAEEAAGSPSHIGFVAQQLLEEPQQPFQSVKPRPRKKRGAGAQPSPPAGRQHCGCAGGQQQQVPLWSRSVTGRSGFRGQLCGRGSRRCCGAFARPQRPGRWRWQRAGPGAAMARQISGCCCTSSRGTRSQKDSTGTDNSSRGCACPSSGPCCCCGHGHLAF